MIRALLKLFNVPLSGLGYLLLEHLKLLFLLLRNCYQVLLVWSCMMHVRKCLCKRCIG
jgi:hypothetical protein